MGDHLERWQQEHANFQRLLDFLERELDVLRRADAPNYELMLDVMYYMTHYPDLFHHPVEDLAFERVTASAPGTAAALQALASQHGALRRDGEALVEVLDDIVNGAIRPRELVEARGLAYVRCFREHMASEDREFLPVARTVLGPADWAEILGAVPAVEDPLFGPVVAGRYAALDEQIGREAKIA